MKEQNNEQIVNRIYFLLYGMALLTRSCLSLLRSLHNTTASHISIAKCDSTHVCPYICLTNKEPTKATHGSVNKDVCLY
jgi:hypothetical protein